MLKAIYFDFEYRNNKDPKELVLLSWMNEGREPQTIDLRDGKGVQEVKHLVQSNSDRVWMAYNGEADLSCMLALGQDIQCLDFIDIMVETRMVTQTHEKYRDSRGSLLSTIRVLDIPNKGRTESDEILAKASPEKYKDETRDIILNHKFYTDDQWDQIVAYGPTDITPLPIIMNKLGDIHKSVVTGVTIDQMLERGRYIKHHTEMKFHGKGFPVDVERLHKIYSEKDELIRGMAISAIEQYTPDLMEKPLYNFKKGKSVFSTQAFADMIERNEIPEWKTTETGQYSLKQDYLESRCKDSPFLLPFYRIRRSIQALAGKDQSQLEHDGYVIPGQRVFGTVTGRASPLPSEGFILNQTPWLRSALIRPHPGKAMLGIDWKSQEIAVAAILSGDKALLQIYETDDIYMSLAIRAKAAPEGATKKTHETIRQAFKSVQLGLNYGKGIKSLAIDIYEGARDSDGKPTMTLKEARSKAKEIVEWHKATFHIYWSWVDNGLSRAKLNGFTNTLRGWTYFVGDRTSNTQLKNFPMQSNAAEMMRVATCYIGESGMDLVCSHHDAFYLNCEIEDIEETGVMLQSCMDRASADVLDGYVIGTDAPKVFTYDEPYWDDRGTEQYGVIQNLLGDVMIHPGANK